MVASRSSQTRVQFGSMHLRTTIPGQAMHGYFQHLINIVSIQLPVLGVLMVLGGRE